MRKINDIDFLLNSTAWPIVLEFVRKERLAWAEDHRLCGLPEIPDSEYLQQLFADAAEAGRKMAPAISSSCLSEE